MDVRKYEIYFVCSPGYLMRKQSERVRWEGPKSCLAPQISAWRAWSLWPLPISAPGDNATTIFQQSQWHGSKAIIITRNTIISLLTSSCLIIIGYCGSTSLGFGSVLCYMKNTILYEDSYLNMSTAAKSTMSKNVDESSFFKKIEWASKINFTYAVDR